MHAVVAERFVQCMVSSLLVLSTALLWFCCENAGRSLR